MVAIEATAERRAGVTLVSAAVTNERANGRTSRQHVRARDALAGPTRPSARERHAENGRGRNGAWVVFRP